MKRKNILKKSSRSVLSISMCIIILFGTFIIGGSANASTSNYSHSAAVDYAKSIGMMELDYVHNLLLHVLPQEE